MSKLGLSIGGACLAVALIGASSAVLGQDQDPGTPKDMIFARKTLMASIGSNMYPIDEMLQTGKIDLVSGRANAESVSAMLMAFPHLFPASTNPSKPEDKRSGFQEIRRGFAPDLRRLPLDLSEEGLSRVPPIPIGSTC